MFSADIRQYKNIEEFQTHLNAIVKPNWVKGVVLHHTWKPTSANWQGETTMNAMKRYYENLGWNAGPHLYICIGSPNPANDGIWSMTPLDTVGIHAGECNSTTWGIEVVGNFDIAPWSDALRPVVYDVIQALLKKIGVSAVTIAQLRGHRECNSPKTCPGAKINMDIVRNNVQKLLFPHLEIVTRDSTLCAPARCTMEQAVAYLSNRQGWYTPNELRNTIVPAYFDFGIISSIDPCVALAQVIHETGFLTSWWSNRPRRNPAGIGVTGQHSTKPPAKGDEANWAYNEQSKQWFKGLSFQSWDKNAVPAHMARLLGYAIPSNQLTSEQRQFIDKYTKDRPLPPKVSGVAPTLAGLEGTWAFPGKGYADKLALQANGIIRM